jgi:hypothetical protein
MVGTPPQAASRRSHAGAPFVVIGSAWVVAGGLVAAVTAHAPSEHATWAAAYLVLVAGFAQVALGAGQAWLAGQIPPLLPVLASELIAWNAGSAAVLAGTLGGVVSITDAGGVLLIVALALMLRATGRQRSGWPLRGYRLLIVIVLVSIPVGLILAHVRAH